MNTSKIILLSAFIISIMSCTNSVKAPDVSQINLDYEITRFEDILYQMDTSDVYIALEKLNEQKPYFSKIYFTQILPLDNRENFETFHASIKTLIRDEAFKEVYNKVKTNYGDFSTHEKELDQAFKYLKYYFPNYQTPNIYTFTSYFGYQCFIFEDGTKDGVGVGLDLFLGEDFDYKTIDAQNPLFSDYITQFFIPEYVVKRIMEQILDDKIGGVQGSKMVDFMLHQGKKLYLMKLLMPHHDDAIVHEYTEQQMNWCLDNESKIWSFFVDKEMIYTTDVTDIKRYTDLAPTSRNMPSESPGRTANYLGLKIVESYMKKHPETSIQQLIPMTDGTSFLQKSGYKPPRL